MDRLLEILASLTDTETTAYLLQQDFVLLGLAAIALLGLLAGAIGPFIVMRQMSFSVHGASELALTGAAAALLFGLNLGLGAIVGSVIAALMFGLMGSRVSQRDSSIGVVLAFGLGLAVLFIHLYPGRSGTAFSLLTGQIVGVSESGLLQMAIVAAIICAALIALYRPLVFSSADPEVAEARGVPVRAINMIFAVLVGLAAAQAVQVVGALLVLSLLITPAAAAAAVTSSPAKAIGLTILFAEVAAVGGMLLSLAPGVPVSVFVTALSFVIYLAARGVGALRR
ncbi:metal ABC transporter permease [Dietzia aerolata]|uniref:Metal ABC transporter permease n=1 Tax=Dietzia aerolata TaxID=595984 RepID=A0ABV5JSW7_9ACTN|nr:metal ABC transporter permease [Dietzia aerolata]MBB0967468.1 metal ABC transporter permease [Dietzia aerolata]HIW69097.1 metal ABC transporter permease [Candidatus Dietzia merdigallinarum]